MTEQKVETIEQMTTRALAVYDVNEARIAELAENYASLMISGVEDKEGLKAVHTARMIVRGIRTTLDSTRKMLKKDALKWGKVVDGEANRIKAMLTPIEAQLQAKEDVIAKELREIEEAEARRLQALLQARVDKLAAVKTRLDIELVREMTDEQFEGALAEAGAIYAELQQEKKDAEAAEAARQEEAKLEREKLEAEKAKLAKEREENEAEKARLAALAEELEEKPEPPPAEDEPAVDELKKLDPLEAGGTAVPEPASAEELLRECLGVLETDVPEALADRDADFFQATGQPPDRGVSDPIFDTMNSLAKRLRAHLGVEA